MTEPTGVVRFGPFEADLRTGELRKSGVNLRLSEQPFQVLAALLEKPGELVTREELRDRLWPDDTFVGFEDSLNTAANKLRQTLGDSARNPKYIETLQGRGYRFVGQIERQPQQPPRTKQLWIASVAAAAVAAIAAVYFLRPEPEPAPLTFVEKPLTSLPGLEMGPAFSPDGSRVAFSCDGVRRVTSNICVQSVENPSGEPIRLTEGPERDLQPEWSPDGEWISFVRVLEFKPPPGGGRYRLMRVPASGGQARTIVDTLSRNDNIWPVWSPDGKFLVYSGKIDPDAISNRLLAVSIESGEVLPFTQAKTGEFLPSFSADGSRFAFKGFAESGRFLGLMDVAGSLPRGEPKMIPEPEGFQTTNFILSADGEEVYFLAESPEGRRGIWAVTPPSLASSASYRALPTSI